MECPICLESLAPGPEKVILPCCHHFHHNCLQQHFIQECPVCRTPQYLVTVLGTSPSSLLDQPIAYERYIVAEEPHIENGDYYPDDYMAPQTFADLDREFVSWMENRIYGFEDPLERKSVRAAKRRIERHAWESYRAG